VSLIEAIMLGISVVTINVELGSNTAKEVGCIPYVVISATGSTPARVDSGVRDVSWDPSTESVSVAGNMIMADGTFSSEDNLNVADTVSWENGETVISAAISTLPVLRTLLALEMMDDMISPWFGSLSSKLLGVGCVSEVRLVEIEVELEADAACSVVWAMMASLDEVAVLAASASENDWEVERLPWTLVWLGKVTALTVDVDSCT
jgi:hypothetical protein